MARMNALFISVIFLFLFSNCSHLPASLEPVEYCRWFDANKTKFIFNKEINPIKYTLSYIPVNYLLAKQILESPATSKQLSNIAEQQMFTLKIGLTQSQQNVLYYHISDNSEYNKRVMYYSFDAVNDMVLVQGKDTLRCLGCDFERTYGLTPNITLNIVFPIGKKYYTGSSQFIFSDVVFNNGLIKILLPEKLLKNIPQLKH